jgi:hypothetical protein
MSEIQGDPRRSTEVPQPAESHNEFDSERLIAADTGALAAMEGNKLVRRRVEQLTDRIGAERLLRSDLIDLWKRPDQSMTRGYLVRAASYAASKEHRLNIRAKQLTVKAERNIGDAADAKREGLASFDEDVLESARFARFELQALRIGEKVLRLLVEAVLRIIGTSVSDRRIGRKAIER